MNIRSSYNKAMAKLDACVDRFPWEDKNCYSLWLAQTFYFVSHSTRLLATASGRFPIGQDTLHYRFAKHIVEESKHERLALADINNLGKDITNLPELSQTSAFYQTQYYWIEHISPISFYGYILLLEGSAVRKGPYATERIHRTLGDKCTSFLKVHGAEDIEHLEEAFDQLEKLDPASLQLIEKNLILSCDIYCSILEEIGLIANQQAA